MATIDTRPYSGNYSGLKNQAILAVCIGTTCLTSFELMRRKRRNTKAFVAAQKEGKQVGLESVESWEWGYLFQGRCWAKRPSPPLPRFPLAWVKQMILFPEEKLLQLVGPDTTVYARFLRGCFYFTLLHSFTTVPILLPIHVVYSPPSIPPKSMTRASLSSLVASQSGQKLLVVHLILLVWIAVTWIAILLWLCKGAFRYRTEFVHFLAAQHELPPSKDTHDHANESDAEEVNEQRRTRGWRLRTIMVSNIPPQLRDEKTLKEYFEFYMSRPLNEPPPAPGLVHGIVSFISRFTQARGMKKAAGEESVPPTPIRTNRSSYADDDPLDPKFTPPTIEKVLVVRKMTELASLLDRREEVLRKLEEAHIKLANKALGAVKEWVEKKRSNKCPNGMLDRVASRRSLVRKSMSHPQIQTQGEEKEVGEMGVDLERGARVELEQEEAMMEAVVNALEPFLYEFGLLKKEEEALKEKVQNEKKWPRKLGFDGTKPWLYRQLGRTKLPSDDSNNVPEPERSTSNDTYPPRRSSNTTSSPRHSSSSSSSSSSDSLPPTIWEALHHLPRDHLDAFQPLVRLNSLFRGATVPSIDYHTAKLGLLTALINENRSRPTSDFAPASTAFVTFERYEDARVAVKCLPSHPKNPLTCLVVPAPEWGDLDWGRLMTRTFTGEFLKDWVVDLGVWAFTCFWIIPVSFFVSLVSIDNLSTLLPWLKTDAFRREILSSLIPTLLVTLLAILVPLLLLLLAKKAHTIVLLSKLHDQIMTRYHKFLVCNVLIFFCVGVSVLQSFLESFRQPKNPLPIIADKFPIAAPFYVGWLIFQTAMHAGLELGLLGLPLLVYPATVRAATTPRKRMAGTRPRTFNFYYWLPNHVVVLFVLFVFSILNPLVIPFGCMYFSVALVVFKHQFIHVYSKAYECNAYVILIRIVRYTLDGLMLSLFVFMALMIILSHNILGAFSGVGFGLTAITKVYLTRFCRSKFEEMDIEEAELFCGKPRKSGESAAPPSGPVVRVSTPAPRSEQDIVDASENVPLTPSHSKRRRLNDILHQSSVRFWTWKLPSNRVGFAYSTVPAQAGSRFDQRRHHHHHLHHGRRHPPNPFGPDGMNTSQADLMRPSRAASVMEERGVTEEDDDGESPTTGSSQPMSLYVSDPFGQEVTPSVHNMDPEVQSPGRPESLIDVITMPRYELVEERAKKPCWDDAPRHDKTYDNPHYIRPIENILWLPKNPWGILDLDETVNFFRAITSEPGAGMLGQWLNESGSMLLEEQSTGLLEPESAMGEFGAPYSPASFVHRELYGGEDIALPPKIASRVEAIDKENDVEESYPTPEKENQNPFMLKGKKSGMSLRRPSISGTIPRKSSAGLSIVSAAGPSPRPGPSPLPFTPGRSFSGGTTGSMNMNRRMSDNLSPGGMYSTEALAAMGGVRLLGMTSTRPRGRGRSGSMATSVFGGDPAMQPDLFSQAPFAQPNLSIILRSNSRLGDAASSDGGGASSTKQFGAIGKGRPRAATNASITAREAVVGEVLAEEQVATAERVRKEMVETQHSDTPRSIWTSWMYKRAEEKTS